MVLLSLLLQRFLSFALSSLSYHPDGKKGAKDRLNICKVTQPKYKIVRQMDEGKMRKERGNMKRYCSEKRRYDEEDIGELKNCNQIEKRRNN